jgi:hypothetical protein
MEVEMAKRARKTSRRAGVPAGSKAAPQEEPDHHHGVSHSEATPDHALPQARGGVVKATNGIPKSGR